MGEHEHKRSSQNCVVHYNLHRGRGIYIGRSDIQGIPLSMPCTALYRFKVETFSSVVVPSGLDFRSRARKH